MKSFFTHIGVLVICLTAFGGQLSAQDQNSHHLIGLWGAGAYSTMLVQADSVSAGLGGAASAGITYEFQKHHFLITVGAGFVYQNSGLKLDNEIRSVPNMVDTQGDVYTLNYTSKERRDRCTATYVQIPLLLGGQFGGFYFLTGGKFGLNLKADTKVKADITTSGIYPQFIDPFVDMPNHGFYSNVPLSQEGTLSINPDFCVSAELGWRLGQRSGKETGFDAPHSGKVQYRLGLFADYGILDIHNGDTKNLIDLPSSTQPDVNGVVLNHVLTTTRAYDKMVNNLYVGLKFTVLFELPKRGICIRCTD